MKKTSNLFRNLLLSAAAMVGISSCTDSVIEGITEVQEGSSNARKVSITVEDFVPGDEQTRTSISKVGDDYRFAWSEGDQICIWAVERTDGTECNGAFNYHTVNGGAGTNKVSFDGGDWGLRSDTKYYAFYPMPEGNPYGINNQRDYRALSYEYQVIDPSDPMAHLAKYDYLASPVQTVEEDGTLNFDFKHLGCLAIFKFKFAWKVSDITGIELKCRSNDGMYSYINFVDRNSDQVNGSWDQEFNIGINGTIATDAEGYITLYAMLPPCDQSGADVDITVKTSTEGLYFRSISKGKNLEAGKAYVFERNFLKYYSTSKLIGTNALHTAINNYLDPYTYQSNVQRVTFITDADISTEYASSHPIVSTSDSESKIYLEYNSGTNELKFVTAASEIRPDNDCSSLFSGFRTLKYTDFTNFYTSDVTDMSSMFINCGQLKTLKISDWDVSKVTSMVKMFSMAFDDRAQFNVNWNATKLESAQKMFENSNIQRVNLSNFKTTENLQTISFMFNGCTNLEEIDLTGLNTKNCGVWRNMFTSCTALRNLDMSSLNTYSCVDITDIFKDCNNIKIDLTCFYDFRVPSGKTFLMDNAFPQTEGVTLRIPWSFLNYLRNHSVDLSKYTIIDVDDD